MGGKNSLMCHTFFVKLRGDSYFLGLLTLLRYFNSLFRECYAYRSLGLGWSQAKPNGKFRQTNKIFMENVNTTRPFSFFFLSLDVVPTISTPEKLAYITGGSAFTS